MSEFGYIGKEVTQSFRDNKGIFTPKDIYQLDREDKWTNFGQLELISKNTISNASTVDITDLGSNYQVHLITMNNMHTNDNKDLNFRAIVGGDVQSGSSDYSRSFRNMYQDGNQYEDKDADLDRLRLNSEIGGNSPEGFNALIYMYNALFVGRTFLTQQQAILDRNAYFGSYYGAGAYQGINVLSGISFYMSSDNINSGNISIYGIRSYT
jgi:hypothetical protein